MPENTRSENLFKILILVLVALTPPFIAIQAQYNALYIESLEAFNADSTKAQQTVQKVVNNNLDILYSLRAALNNEVPPTVESLEQFQLSIDFARRYPGITNLFIAEHETDNLYQVKIMSDDTPIDTNLIGGQNYLLPDIIQSALDPTKIFVENTSDDNRVNDNFIALLPVSNISTSTSGAYPEMIVGAEINRQRLFNTVLAEVSLNSPNLDFRIYDGKLGVDALLFNTDTLGNTFGSSHIVDAGNRKWILNFSANEYYGLSSLDETLPLIVFFGTLSLTMFVITAMYLLVLWRNNIQKKKLDQLQLSFAAVASHQLRTPLTGIKWFATLLRKTQLSDQQLEQVDYILDSSDELIELVNNLLVTSNADTTKFSKQQYHKFEFKTLIDNVLEKVTPKAEIKEVTIEANVENVGEMEGLQTELEQAISNILDNAVKYSQPGGKVTLNASASSRNIIIEIADTGIGIPKSQQSRLFEKFFRAENAIAKIPEGSGLGLYITRQLIRQHRGSISVHSEEEKGTTVVIVIPRNKPK